MIDYLKVGEIPAYYSGLTLFDFKGDPLGRISEADLVTMQGLKMIGYNRQDWDNPDFVRHAERWGAKNVMFRTPQPMPGFSYCKIPKNAVVEGRESLRYGNGSLFGMSRVLVWVNVAYMEVHLTQETAHLSHLVHPNCEVIFI